LAVGAFVNASDAGSIGDARPCADQRPRLAVAGQDAEDDEGDPDERADTAAHSTAPMTPSATNAVRTHTIQPIRSAAAAKAFSAVMPGRGALIG